MDGCLALVGLCTPLLALKLGATYDDLGFIGAMGALAYTLSCLIAGRLSDSLGYRRVMTIAVFAITCIFAGYLFVTHIWHLALLAALTGMTIANFWPPLQAWLGQKKNRRGLRQVLGRFNIAWSMGFLVGPALGGILFEWEYRYAFALCAILTGLLGLAFILIHFQESDVQVDSAAETVVAPLNAHYYLPLAWLANFATFFTIGTVRSLFPKLATDLGIAPGSLGYLMALIAFAQLTAFYLMSRTDRWQFKIGPVIAAQLCAVLGMASLAQGSQALVFAIGLLLLGALAGVTFTISIYYSLYTTGPGGRRTGIHEAIVGSGFLVGPLAGGLIAEHLGARAPYWVSAGVICCVVFAQVAILNKKPTRELMPQAGD